jgi:hypothetical protein
LVKSKFLDIVKTFSPQELKDFRDFIHSPYHNRNKKVRLIFEIVKKNAPAWESEKLSKEKIFQKLFPGKQYNDVVMRILLSDLVKLTEEFLAFSRYKTSPFIGKKLLLDELKERKLDSFHSRHLRLAEEMLVSSGITNQSYFLDLYNLKSSYIDFMIAHDKQIQTTAEVLKQGEHLLFFSLIGLLNTAHELLTHQEIVNISIDVNLVAEFLKDFNLDAFMGYLKKIDHEYYPVAAIYYYMYKTCEDEKDEYYFKLKELVEENLHRFGREEKFNLLIILESTCVSKLSSGKQEFYRHLMDIYEFMIKEDLLTHTKKDYIQTNLFRNIFYIAVILKKYEWAEEFIEHYNTRINPEQKENMFHFSRAFLCFEKKQFENALENISKVTHKFFVFKFDAKVLMLKIYYELEEYEPALSLIDSFYHFLSNNKSIHSHDRERFGNFLKYLKLFIKLKDGPQKKDAGLLKKEISSAGNIINQKWLIEKAKELE